MLSTNLGKASNDHPALRIVITMLDILIILIPYLPSTQSKQLFELSMNKEILAIKDNAVQKRVYRILSKLLEDSDFNISVENVLQTINDLSGDSAAAAKKVI